MKMLNPPPIKLTNKSRRSREFLTPNEVDSLMIAAKKSGRHKHRDHTMILMGYRHGLRVSELISLRWQQIDLNSGLIQVNRLKNGLNSVHPLFGPELRALRKIKRKYPNTEYIFMSERGSPMTASAFRKIIARAGKIAEMDMPIHPHMLRHSTGFKLANESRDTRSIQQYLGHKNIRHTTLYTELAADKFTDFWPD
jgi:site-specific recombinase XerD|tara:strand:- start:1296 stop:1883 length:588 start_codon:yes stop_codon:yes gene_type:complete